MKTILTSKNTPVSNVFFLPLNGEETSNVLFSSTNNILNHKAFHLLREFCCGELVGIKPSNISPSFYGFVTAVAEMLHTRQALPFICDTSDRHFNQTGNAVKQTAAMMEKFNTDSHFECPIVMLDGIHGDHEISSREKNKGNGDIYIAGELPSLHGIVIISEVVPDPLCGIGGSIFGIGNGLASKRGKIRQYSMSLPRVNIEKCYTCRRCLHNCPTGAIFMADNHVDIDKNRCINCGKCVEIARFGGITYDWNATPAHFQSSMTHHASAALQYVGSKLVCINIISRTSSGGSPQDQGILFSTDPVAIDAAAINLYGNNGSIKKDQVLIAEELIAKAESAGIGTGKYKLETIAY